MSIDYLYHDLKVSLVLVKGPIYLLLFLPSLFKVSFSFLPINKLKEQSQK